jgi:hypothetical protein
VPHGILKVFNNILYENEFQNPQIFQQSFTRAFYFKIARYRDSAPANYFSPGREVLSREQSLNGSNDCFVVVVFVLVFLFFFLALFISHLSQKVFFVPFYGFLC